MVLPNGSGRVFICATHSSAENDSPINAYILETHTKKSNYRYCTANWAEEARVKTWSSFHIRNDNLINDADGLVDQNFSNTN